MRQALALLSLLLLAGCGDSPEPDVTPGTEAYTAAYRAVCAARGLPLAPGDGPNQHFRLIGQASFTLRDSERAPIVQQLEIALGGPARQRYQLEASGSKNWFLLASPTEAWKKLPNQTQVEEYQAQELAEDAWLRWMILRYPWESPADTEVQADPVLWSPSHSEQTFELMRDQAGLPTQVLRRTPGGSEALLEVSDWQADKDGTLFPRTWRWNRSSFILEESFEQLEPGVLYFDFPFRPTASAPRAYTISRTQDNQSLAPPSESFAVVERNASWFEESLGTADLLRSDWSLWRSYDAQAEALGEWRIVEATASQRLGADWQAVGEMSQQLCFYWASPRMRDPQTVYQRLLQAAQDNAYQLDGPLWIRLDGLGLEALLPVKRAQ